MKFLLCVLLSSCAIRAMDAEDASAEMDCSSEQAESEQAEFDVEFEHNFDDWLEQVQGNSPSDDEEAAESSDEKRIKRTRPTQQNFRYKVHIEIARQNLYRLGGIARPATPAVAHSFFKPQYTDGTYYLTCPVCFYKLAAKEMGRSQPSRLKVQLNKHLTKSNRHPFDGTSHYKEEWLKGRVIPLYDAMVAGRNFKDLCTQGHDALLEDKELPAENPYTLKKLKSE